MCIRDLVYAVAIGLFVPMLYQLKKKIELFVAIVYMIWIHFIREIRVQIFTLDLIQNQNIPKVFFPIVLTNTIFKIPIFKLEIIPKKEQSSFKTN